MCLLSCEIIRGNKKLSKNEIKFLISKAIRSPRQISFSGCQSPGSDVTDGGPIRRSKKIDDSKNQADLRKCLGLKVLARRGDTFRTAQVKN